VDALPQPSRFCIPGGHWRKQTSPAPQHAAIPRLDHKVIRRAFSEGSGDSQSKASGFDHKQEFDEFSLPFRVFGDARIVGPPKKAFVSKFTDEAHR
jgi:hypothetical protein